MEGRPTKRPGERKGIANKPGATPLLLRYLSKERTRRALLAGVLAGVEERMMALSCSESELACNVHAWG
jgi:hypothetical protein